MTCSGRIAAGEAELLAYIGEFDAREAWGGAGLLSCAHWLSWRTGLSPSAAREKVRVARALRELPQVQESFGAGRLSYSPVRAVTRVATPEDQERWIEAARCATAGQLEELIRGVRRACKLEQDAADPERAAWTMRATKTYDEDGNAVYRIVLPAQEAAVVDAALEAMQAEPDRRAADASAGSEFSTAGHLGRRPGRDGTGGPGRAATGDSTPSPLVAGGSGRSVERLRSPAGRRAAAAVVSARGHEDAARSRRAAAAQAADRRDLRLHDLGRSQRQPSLALRELLGALDGERCRFPGCTRHRTLQAHHVTYWTNDGTTDLSNLVLVCARHHTLIHQLGFSLVLHPDRTLTVTTPEGVPVLHHPGIPWGDPAELDPDRRITADTLPPDNVVARIDISYAVMVLAQQAA